MWLIGWFKVGKILKMSVIGLLKSPWKGLWPLGKVDQNLLKHQMWNSCLSDSTDENQMPLHSVEISLFFHYSDFTWKQFRRFYKCKICQFHTFRLKIFTFREFLHFLTAKFYQINKIQSLQIFTLREFLHFLTAEFYQINKIQSL